MNENRINIICATDDNYVPYCGVMLTSLFENNRDRQIHVYVLVGSALLVENQKLLKQLAYTYSQVLEFCVVKTELFDRFAIQGEDKKYLSIVTYYRLFAVDLLPEDVSHVLYLDCDIIIDGSIGELFDYDWTNYAIGVVPDMCTQWTEFYNRLQYDKSLGYFNAGVVLINLDYWRKHNIAKQCLDYMAHNYEKLKNNDQDVLNVVMCHAKRQLPITYNFQIQLLMPYFFHTFSKEMQLEIRGTISPKIIHYAAELKPWMAYYYSYPFYSTWQKYKRLSPWKNMPEKLPNKRKCVAFIKRYIFWPLGLWLKKPELI